MANKNVFSSLTSKVPATNTTNLAGGKAYKFSDKHALAQMAVTGCLNDTFYAGAQDQLTSVLGIAQRVLVEDPAFVARVALYARTHGFMKDMPALLCAVLASSDKPVARAALKQIFPKVIDNAKMLRNFAQIVRSGVTGRKSFGTQIKRLMQKWFEGRTADQIFRDSVGDAPSLVDVIKMVHPHPTNAQQEALFAYLLKKMDLPTLYKDDGSAVFEERVLFEKSVNKYVCLPTVVQQFERWKKVCASDPTLLTKEVAPDVPFQMLTSLPLPPLVWGKIAKHANWHTLRMNLNTFARHKVFEIPGMTEFVANKLADAELIRKARVFPYQLFVAARATGAEVPGEIRHALHKATDHALVNMPTFEGKHVFVCPDISGSMSMAVTGQRTGSTSAVSCADVAALTAAAVLAKNPTAKVLPFSDSVAGVFTNESAGFKDGVLKTTEAIRRLPSGGTDCAAPVEWVRKNAKAVDVIILVSDNESWVNPGAGRGTRVMEAWVEIKRKNPNALLVCLDLAPNTTTQAPETKGVLNIGGFSDAVFDVIGAYARAGAKDDNGKYWVEVVEQMTADPA